MIIYYGLCLLLVVAKITSTDISTKDDPCKKFDKCRAKTHQRTCSCALDCNVYGTCCKDSKIHKTPVSKPPFQCYQHRMASPVFAKRSCVDNYRGFDDNIPACMVEDVDVDAMDVNHNLPVTSRKTKITYWNFHCGICNYEDDEDLELWTVEVICPQRDEVVDERLIRRNLTYVEETEQWGLNIQGEFLSCVLKYTPPPYNDEPEHCTSNLISSCPEGYNNSDIAMKCSQYYGERRSKNSNNYYKNVYCAICNDVDLKELECSGMSRPEDYAEETDFGQMVAVDFPRGQWLIREKGHRFPCSKGFLFNPAWMKCTPFEWKPLPIVAQNSSERHRLGLLAFLTFLLFLVLA